MLNGSLRSWAMSCSVCFPSLSTVIICRFLMRLFCINSSTNCIPHTYLTRNQILPALKHKSVPVCRRAVPRDLLKEDRFLLRDDVKDADGVGQCWVLNVLPGDPHMVRIQPAKSEGVPPTGWFHGWTWRFYS